MQEPKIFRTFAVKIKKRFVMNQIKKKFNNGDIVRLKSDSEDTIPMTIQAYKYETLKDGIFAYDLLTEEDKHSVYCVWRDKYDMPHKELYHEDALESVSTSM